MRRMLSGISTIALVGVTMVSVRAVMQPREGAPPSHEVTQADIDRWKTELSNWGRWGKDDERGTLNLITPDKKRQAAALVKEGYSVSMARDAATDKDVDNPFPYEQAVYMITDSLAVDRIAMNVHGLANTHLDALAHHAHDGKLYNGFPFKEHVTAENGATKGSIIAVKDGVFTRGVLMDIPRLKGVPYLEPGTPIFVEDLEAWEKQAGIKVSPGDAVFIRTGRWLRRAQKGAWNLSTEGQAGLDASVIPWIRQRDIALIASESALSVVPFPSTTRITKQEDNLPLHNFVMVALGMTVIDNCQLDAVAEAAAARGRWEFLVTVNPLTMVKGTGSPINPVAVF